MKRSSTVQSVLDALKANVAEKEQAARLHRIERLRDVPHGLIWYVGISASGRDFRVEAELRKRGFVAVSLREVVSIGDRARRRDVDRPLMPRYVFFATPDGEPARFAGKANAAMTGQDIGAKSVEVLVADMERRGLLHSGARAACKMGAARAEASGYCGIDGLEAVICDGATGVWRPVPDAAVLALIKAELAGLFDRTETTRKGRREMAARRLHPGDSVQIVDGWLAGAMAKVIKVRPANRLTVLLELFGSGMRAELRFDSLAISA